MVFDNYGIVISKNNYDLNNMNELKIVKSITTKKYDTKSKFGKIITSLEQKINAPKINRKNK